MSLLPKLNSEKGRGIAVRFVFGIKCLGTEPPLYRLQPSLTPQLPVGSSGKRAPGRSPRALEVATVKPLGNFPAFIPA